MAIDDDKALRERVREAVGSLPGPDRGRLARIEQEKGNQHVSTMLAT